VHEVQRRGGHSQTKLTLSTLENTSR